MATSSPTEFDTPSGPWDVVVVGAGAAGLVAAERAAARGLRTLLVEKNRKPGVKILISGGTRCNLTHATDARGIVTAYGSPGRFLHSALAALSPSDLVALVEAEGVATKIEPDTGKIFPASDRALDVLGAFLARLRRTDCELALDEALLDVEQTAVGFRLTTRKRLLDTKKLVLTTGGQSYPGCGTTGDGYRLATKLGHSLIAPRPALVPVTISTPWVQELSGVTVPDTLLSVIDPGQIDNKRSGLLDTRRGSLLFTHFGLSGPVALDISRVVTAHERPQSLRMECDFLPNITLAALEDEIKVAAAAAGKKQLLSLVPETVPRRLAESLLRAAGLDAEKKAGELSKIERHSLARALKQTMIAINGTRGFLKAEVTAGGIPLAEVDSRTLESKIVPGLHLAGELLDLDGPIGGYNFQAAFSTGWLTGLSV
ncbi:MAG: NAD(P)/FAD-dependent oxidoreductase [Singulisphaera sp.]